jgi:predicted nucleotidyltransferase
MAPMVPVNQLKRVLDETPAVRLAVLSGSAARQADGSGSDLDVGVSFAEGGTDLAPALAVALERAAGRRVDLVPLDAAPPLLRFEIARDGVVVVERLRGAWAEFQARAMIDWWDWAPTARMMHRVMAEKLREEAGRRSA